MDCAGGGMARRNSLIPLNPFKPCLEVNFIVYCTPILVFRAMLYLISSLMIMLSACMNI